MKFAYKLVTLRVNGTLGPLFIGKSQILPIGKWITSEEKPTKGFAFRPGWHCCEKPLAPHLTKKGSVTGHYISRDFQVVSVGIE